MRHVFVFCTLFACYYIFSGINSPFFIGAGVVSAAIGTFVAARLGALDKIPLITPKLLRYCLWLSGEIIKSSLAVIGQILSKKPNFSGGFLLVKLDSQSDFAVTTYANSITLTPGTVTVRIFPEQGEMLVHALTKETADDLSGGAMQKKILEI